MMIAGHARSMGLILVTNNMKEFEHVPGLRIENWVSQYHISNVELARRMGVTENVVRRLIDPDHRSHIGQVEAALDFFMSVDCRSFRLMFDLWI